VGGRPCDRPPHSSEAPREADAAQVLRAMAERATRRASSRRSLGPGRGVAVGAFTSPSPAHSLGAVKSVSHARSMRRSGGCRRPSRTGRRYGRRSASTSLRRPRETTVRAVPLRRAGVGEGEEQVILALRAQREGAAINSRGRRRELAVQMP